MNLRRLQVMMHGNVSAVSLERAQTPVPVRSVLPLCDLVLIKFDGKLPVESDRSPPVYNSQPRNVIIFGETGAGKSSVINLIAADKIAQTSPDAAACTMTSTAYHVVLQSDQPFCIWDTIGLNEAGLVCEDYLRAIEKAYKLIKELNASGGVHLLLLCMRGRITSAVQQNYKLFFDIFCEKQVPLGIVVTHLENEPNMETWWNKNEESFKHYGVSTRGHACITATSGLDDVYLERYEESREMVRKLLLGLSSAAAWQKERRIWFSTVLGNMARMLPRLSRSPTRRELVKKLVHECKFSQSEAEAIANSIETIRNAK
jgi:predicted GTPase